MDPSGNPYPLTADAEDVNNQVYPLQVEYAHRVAVSEIMYAIHVRLSDQMTENGDVLVRLYSNGVPSNRVRVGLGHVGGGLPDDGGPQITALSPSTVLAASDALLSVSGSRFTLGSKLFLNGIEHSTTVASDNLLFCPLTSSDVAMGGNYAVSVQSSTGISNSLSLTVANPQPSSNSLSPSSVIKGGSGFTLSVNGTGFVQGSTVKFNNSSRVTAFVNATLLTAQIFASDVAVAGSFPVTVVNATPGGGTSAAVSFVVAPPTPTPTPSPTPTATPSPTPAPTPVPGLVFYVAPNGSPSGIGSITNPWDLQTALNQPLTVLPGSTIYLRGGTYVGKFTSRLNSLPNAPIVVRSYPGEWARLDGYQHATLAEPLPANNNSGDWVTLKFTSNPGFANGTGIMIGMESIYISRTGAFDGTTWNRCLRASGGTAAIAHQAGEDAHDNRDGLAISGSYVHFRDFEVFNSNALTPRSYDFRWSNASLFGGYGVFVNPGANSVKLINLVVHDNAGGIFAGQQADSLEIYGCITFNNGFVDWDRGHGLGIYALNSGPNFKKIRNVITFNEFGAGMKAYSESQHAENVLFEHVISFNNGVLASFPGNRGDNGAPLSPNDRYNNIYAGTGNSNNPINNIKIHNSYLYHPPDTKPESGNLSLGYQAPRATGLEITNSRIMGGNRAVALAHFSGVTFTDNKIYAQKSGNWTQSGDNFLVALTLESPTIATWKNNTYYDQIPRAQGVSYPFYYTLDGIYRQGCSAGSPLRFDETCASPRGGWKQVSSFDADSSYVFGAPTGTEVFVIRNDYEVGRAHIAIYNWALMPIVNVSLSNVLTNGDRYAIYAVEDYLGTPVTTGTYTGGSVAIPMTGTSVAAPIGLGWKPTTVRPQFGAFVVRKQ